MPKDILAYTILWFLFQSVAEINCQTVPFKPEKRRWHTATLINSKLYILGGYSPSSGYVGKDFFYLDVSVPFNTQNLLWQDLSSVNTVPSLDGAASVNGGANNNTLFLYGGFNTAMELVYTFNPQNNSWNIPKITGNNNIMKKRDLTGIIDDNGKMYKPIPLQCHFVLRIKITYCYLRHHSQMQHYDVTERCSRLINLAIINFEY